MNAKLTALNVGSGKDNTETMKAKWNAKAFGEQNTGGNKDIWGEIEEEEIKGWFVPSREEWAAFGGELEVTKKNYSSLGMHGHYWSSSIHWEDAAWTCNFISGEIESNLLFDGWSLRLSTTF